MTNAEVGTIQSGGYKYGSVNKDDEEAAGNNNDNNNSYFKESDLYYYKEDELTKKEKMMKIIKSCIPILIAVLLIGGITWILVQNFGTLYPSPGQRQRIRPSTGIETSSSSSSHHNAPLNDDDSIHAPTLTPRTSKDTTATTATTSSTKDNGKSSCSAYSKCFDLGLTGECCPTLAGDKLECCN